MTKNAPDDEEYLRSQAEDPPTPESHPQGNSHDDPTRLARDRFHAEMTETDEEPKTDGGSADVTPGVDGGETGSQTRPQDTRDDTKTMIAAFGAGLIAGVGGGVVGIEGLVALIGAALGIDGIHKRTGYITDEARDEPLAFALGAVIGWAIIKYGLPYIQAL